MPPSVKTPELGLRANRRQFWLLVLVNAFVGAMIGLERTVLPLLGQREFALTSATAVLSFIATFGIVKALANVAAGWLADRFGRKRVLVAGWLLGAPVPFLIIWAPTWSWIVAANVLLGASQGLAWSMTVVMKIDLVGPERRGFAMGLNEFAGYVAVASSAYATGMIASRYGLRPEPFYLGIAFVAIGTSLSLLFVGVTMAHARHEASAGSADARLRPPFRELFWLVSWRDPALFSVSQAGLVNNLNDGVAWGLFPLFFAAAGLSLREIALLSFVYPATWGMLQVGMGSLSDRVGRKWLIALGMIVQGIALVVMIFVNGVAPWLFTGALLGTGTAMVYPTLLAAVGDAAHPTWRGTAVGIYRLWRDLGYAAGALAAGLLTDFFGMRSAIATVGVVTAAAGLLVAARMPETRSG
jgi:MFS family permease